MVITANTASLTDLCTVSNVQASLPSNGTLLGLDLLPGTVTASAVYNATLGGGDMGPDAHTGKRDVIPLISAFREPSNVANRFYLSGGGGYALSSDATGGFPYGTTSGATSGNGTVNLDATYAFAYTALEELTKIRKPVTQGFYGLNDIKFYTCFEGCFDGGREAMSQVQRWGKEYNGIVADAPAFRFAQQQVLHIVNATIVACDPFDGRTDSVISRTDLCKLNFNLSSLIGESYYCAAQTSTSLGFGFSKRGLNKRQMLGSQTSAQPEQDSTINANNIALAQSIYDGLHNSKGDCAYLSWQIGSELSDADPTYNNATGEWELSIPSTGGEYVADFVQLLDLDNLTNLDNVTYDDPVELMNIGMVRYLDSLQTTLPDLTPFQSSGAKMIHCHSESDPSILAASSVHYW
ncbi:tannase [Alternaria panax]|uniref:Carboxylic ester hydrolase n=1 Tax=Alternaria panax TaxID=48097 RepID=A0AAD4FIN5_9PLEO|nr:tannase [Alternaria panax]